jgi:hypothetical protein
MFWETAPAEETTPIKDDNKETATESEGETSTTTAATAPTTPAPEVAPEPADGGFFTDPARFWGGVGESISKTAEDIEQQNEKNMNDFRTEWGRGVAAMNDGALNFGRILEEGVEDEVEDLVFQEQMKTMNAAAEELKEFIMSNPLSIKVQGFLCAFVVVLTCLLSCIVNFLNANVIVGLLHLVFMAIGLVFVLVEYKPMFVPARVGKFIREEIRFLFKPFGRPIVLNIAAMFIISQSSMDTMMGMESALGGSVAFCMTLFIFFLTYQASHELHAVKDLHIPYAELSQKFNAADTMMKGKLDTHQFVGLMHSISKDDKEVSYEDIQTALLELDENHDGEISWDEFIAWYERKDDYLC